MQKKKLEECLLINCQLVGCLSYQKVSEAFSDPYLSELLQRESMTHRIITYAVIFRYLFSVGTWKHNISLVNFKCKAPEKYNSCGDLPTYYTQQPTACVHCIRFDSTIRPFHYRNMHTRDSIEWLHNMYNLHPMYLYWMLCNKNGIGRIIIISSFIQRVQDDDDDDDGFLTNTATASLPLYLLLHARLPEWIGAVDK